MGNKGPTHDSTLWRVSRRGCCPNQIKMVHVSDYANQTRDARAEILPTKPALTRGQGDWAIWTNVEGPVAMGYVTADLATVGTTLYGEVRQTPPCRSLYFRSYPQISNVKQGEDQ